MAPSPLVTATLQSAVLSATSNILAQAITAYRSDVGKLVPSPLVIDWVPVFQFLLFTFVSTPPNFLWQEFLESTFPSTTRAAPTAEALAAAATDDEKELDKEAREGRLVEPGHLHIGHTMTKFVLDQTVGAAVNTVLFSTFTHSIQAAMAHRPATAGPGADSAAFLASGKALDYSQVDWRVVVARSRLDFWPLMRAALGLWPWVSLFNFTMVKTVEMRNLVGALAGVVWGVYMSLFAAQ